MLVSSNMFLTRVSKSLLMPSSCWCCEVEKYRLFRNIDQ